MNPRQVQQAQVLKGLADLAAAQLAIAESVTAGRVQAMVSHVSGASTFFLGGVTTYTLQSKTALLGINREHAESVNCVSKLVAEQMAEGVACLYGANLSVATTGYAERNKKPRIDRPFAYCAVWHRLKTGDVRVKTCRVTCAGLRPADPDFREKMQERVASRAVALLIDALWTDRRLP